MKTSSLNFTELKNIVSIANNYGVDKKELLENIENENNDFEVDNYRFILESDAEEIAKNMYECDAYMLGCFNDWFIADNCNINCRAVQALQKAEAFTELGEMMLDNGIDELISEYCRLDGYGHVFGSYDGNNDEVTINGDLYIVFRTN